jgi:succinoglycan biosynthesis protein ExoM
VEVRIVVVENDDDGEARVVVESFAGGRFPIEYAAEPRHGIPFARNRALEVAGDVDFIAFLDDDEWAESQWLAELLDAQEKTGAEVVLGPVLPDFEAQPPRWLLGSGYFDPLSFEPLQSIGFAYTGNVLVARAAFDSERPFPERLALMGGSDTHFFMRAWLRGIRIVWAPAARVHEAIPLQRMRVGWIARREYRRGTTLSLCLLDLEPSRRRKLKRVVHGVGRIAIGSALAPATLVRGRSMLARAAKESSFGVGLLLGLTGRGYQEYRDTGPPEARR